MKTRSKFVALSTLMPAAEPWVFQNRNTDNINYFLEHQPTCMASPNYDEDLKLAMALSMQQSPPTSSHHPIANNEAIDLTSDTEEQDENEDIRRAIELSLQETGVSSDQGKLVAKGSLPTPSTSYQISESGKPSRPSIEDASTAASDKLAGISGLDRKAMEQERLTRLGKRKRDSSPERPSKQIAKMHSMEGAQASSIQSHSVQSAILRYSRGAIKRTFATKYSRTNDITVDEVLQADSVNIAVISSFMWDSEWLNKKLNPLKVKQIWIMNAKDQDVQERFKQEMKDCGVPNSRMHFPPMNGMIHSMHSKFMLLFGEDNLRFVVPTANMTPIDWGEVKNDWQPGVMENSIFLIDLPRRSDGEMGDRAGLTVFGKELIHYLEEQKLGNNVIEGVLKFDFSQTDHLAFVHSM